MEWWVTYTKLHWDGEKVTASLLCNCITTGNTWKVDEGGLDDASLTILCPDKFFGESTRVSGVE